MVQSESKDGKLEIIKRIKKVNPDGSYTIGYEADDGSFKIESRDVLGNIKGTYGFVDDEGDIKRVSYSSSNASEIFSKHEPVSTPEFPTQSVVQRIPKSENSPTTKKPSTYPTTTPSTPTTTPISVIQSIARRRASSTTLKPNYNSIETVKSSQRPNSVVYTSAAPRVLLQRPSLASTVSTNARISESRSEGQISRPEVSEKPTELPIYRSLHSKRFDDEKPVTEEASELRPNILRRQLPQDSKGFNAEEHVYSLQQSFGHNDVSDIYNNGVTVTSRPLFTTTRSNRIAPIISSTTASPASVPKPIAKYAANYQRNQLQEVESSTATYSHPVEEVVTSTETSGTPTNVPVVQIPANRAATSEPLVAIRHPFQQGAILVPLSQLQNRIIPIENMQDIYDARRHYVSQQQQPVQLTTRAPTADVDIQRLKRLNQPALRPIPVHVDENGFIREMPQHVPTPYPLPVPITPAPISVRAIAVASRQIDNDVNNDIENIQPPVSTRDFQTLLNHLIMRQKRLEKISLITNPKLRPDLYQPQPVRYQRLVPAPQPYYIQRVQRPDYNQQRQEADQAQQRGSTRQYVAIRPQETDPDKRYMSTYQYQQEDTEIEEPKRLPSTYERQQGYLINRRAGRLLPARPNQVTPVYSQGELSFLFCLFKLI